MEIEKKKKKKKKTLIDIWVQVYYEFDWKFQDKNTIMYVEFNFIKIKIIKNLRNVVFFFFFQILVMFLVNIYNNWMLRSVPSVNLSGKSEVNFR